MDISLYDKRHSQNNPLTIKLKNNSILNTIQRETVLDLTELLEAVILVLVSTELVELAYHLHKMKGYEGKIDHHLTKMDEHITKMDEHINELEDHMTKLYKRLKELQERSE